jgi:hypothetical protein
MNRRQFVASSGVALAGPLLTGIAAPSLALGQAKPTPLSTSLVTSVTESLTTVAQRAFAGTATASDYTNAAAQAQSLYNAWVANNIDVAIEAEAATVNTQNTPFNLIAAANLLYPSSQQYVPGLSEAQIQVRAEYNTRAQSKASALNAGRRSTSHVRLVGPQRCSDVDKPSGQLLHSRRG